VAGSCECGNEPSSSGAMELDSDIFTLRRGRALEPYDHDDVMWRAVNVRRVN
jgi:hypothetical protein